MIYIFSWFILYLIGLINYFSRYRGNLFTIFVFLIFSIIIFVRGEVGSDTITYQNMAYSIEGLFEQVEVGYSALIIFLKNFTNNPVLIIRLVAIIFSLLFMYIYISGSFDEKFMIFYYLLPAFFLGFGMNVIRIGFASLFFYIAVKFFFHKKFIKMLIFVFISILFHYSIIISYIFIYSIYFKLITLKSIFIFIFILVFLYFTSYNYLNEKFILYFSSPSIVLFALSGTSSIMVISLILLSIKFSDIDIILKKRIIVNTILFTILFYFISLYSYAGLRMIELLKYSLPIIFIFLLFKFNIRLNSKSKLFIFLAGLISVFFSYRNFLESYGLKSGFLPYKTFFE